jgi:alkanesulfonate monooxygenase SsuD/methylene tetrahydromethanopterin reductase-like flavin-dependent oxidoreductase (luciferase family)
MSDYGHDIEFGTFITPVNRPPRQAVELARLSERLGFDLATFQDHPYQPAFHDTWTLMSFVAASTSRIRLAGNVHNLPLRQPAVLARSIASLDLLTGGRIEFGLGAGNFWDAIEAMGGRRLAPADAVTALSQAIDVIRGVWNVDGDGRLVAGGEFYRVDGAKRGPRPAHDVPIWIGAYQPRLLRLVGETANVWLPSLGYLTRGAFEASNGRIDDAAHAAGRQPGEVRRLLNVGALPGDAEQQAETLTGFALEHGFSVFIVPGVDPAVLEAFAAEVAPRVREAVAAARTSHPSTS